MNTTLGGDSATPTLIDIYDVADAVVALTAHVASTLLAANAVAKVTVALRLIRLLKYIFTTPPVLDRI